MPVESWKIRCQQQCLAEPDAKSTGKLVAFWMIVRQKHACIVEADESARKRMEGPLHKAQEDHIAVRGNNISLNHKNLVHKFIPMPEAMKNTRCKSSRG